MGGAGPHIEREHLALELEWTRLTLITVLTSSMVVSSINIQMCVCACVCVCLRLRQPLHSDITSDPSPLALPGGGLGEPLLEGLGDPVGELREAVEMLNDTVRERGRAQSHDQAVRSLLSKVRDPQRSVMDPGERTSRWSWMELGGAGWSWVELGGARWSWVELG